VTDCARSGSGVQQPDPARPFDTQGCSLHAIVWYAALPAFVLLTEFLGVGFLIVPGAFPRNGFEATKKGETKLWVFHYNLNVCSL
jgi:hypothetical protein